MQIRFFILFITFYLLSGCEKDEYKSTGTITGADMAFCACCGGYFIDIDSVEYRLNKESLPGNFTFTDSLLPITVELDWNQNVSYCKDFNWINVTKIRLKSPTTWYTNY